MTYKSYSDSLDRYINRLNQRREAVRLAFEAQQLAQRLDAAVAEDYMQPSLRLFRAATTANRRARRRWEAAHSA